MKLSLIPSWAKVSDSLPGRQDYPLICFRLEAAERDLSFVTTDKLGNPGKWLGLSTRESP